MGVKFTPSRTRRPPRETISRYTNTCARIQPYTFLRPLCVCDVSTCGHTLFFLPTANGSNGMTFSVPQCTSVAANGPDGSIFPIIRSHSARPSDAPTCSVLSPRCCAYHRDHTTRVLEHSLPPIGWPTGLRPHVRFVTRRMQITRIS